MRTAITRRSVGLAKEEDNRLVLRGGGGGGGREERQNKLEAPSTARRCPAGPVGKLYGN